MLKNLGLNDLATDSLVSILLLKRKILSTLVAMSTSAPIPRADYPHVMAADYAKDFQIYVLERP